MADHSGVTIDNWEVKDSLGDKIARIFHSKKTVKTVMMGVGQDGRTCFLQRLLTGQMTEPERTKSFTTEIFTHKKHEVIMDDLSGAESLRNLWNHHVQGKHVLIWTLDSTRPDLVETSRKALHNLMKENQIADVPLLVLLTKVDEGKITPQEAAEGLALSALTLPNVHIQSTSSKTGVGLKEALDWVVTAAEANKLQACKERGL